MTKKEIISSLLPDIKLEVLNAKGSNKGFDKCLPHKGMHVNTIVSIRVEYKHQDTWVNIFCDANDSTENVELILSNQPFKCRTLFGCKKPY